MESPIVRATRMSSTVRRSIAQRTVSNVRVESVFHWASIAMDRWIVVWTITAMSRLKRAVIKQPVFKIISTVNMDIVWATNGCANSRIPVWIGSSATMRATVWWTKSTRTIIRTVDRNVNAKAAGTTDHDANSVISWPVRTAVTVLIRWIIQRPNVVVRPDIWAIIVRNRCAITTVQMAAYVDWWAVYRSVSVSRASLVRPVLRIRAPVSVWMVAYV